MNELFSVCQVFTDGTHEYVSRDVGVNDAVEAFASCIGLKTTIRVMILGKESVNLEWTLREGIRKA